jgi:hypothetical protein
MRPCRYSGDQAACSHVLIAQQPSPAPSPRSWAKGADSRPASGATASLTCEAGQFTLAGWLEPAAAVGGDTFDYSLDRDCLQVSITDAVGHQVTASLLATLLSAACATAAGRVSASASRPATPTTAWPRTRRPASS